jgi:hypothetical protein
MEKGLGYRGKRFFLEKVRGEQNSELIPGLRRRQYIRETDETEFLVYFKVVKELPLLCTGGEDA